MHDIDLTMEEFGWPAPFIIPRPIAAVVTVVRIVKDQQSN
jgi:hypothetical protein